MSKSKRLCLYLHTHWDREWYLAFEEYRTQLTFAVEEILQGLESGKLPSFMLDGQSCILEDLQEVDATLTERIKALMTAGKIEAGPWYVLADQLLVGGESLLRNLEMGLAVTRRYGQPSMIGYCPDTFGHSQDLPRILQSYGITTAIVWRGVPDMSGHSLFWWVSADGSRVLTYHLSKGYYQTAFFEDRAADNLAEHLLSWRHQMSEAARTPSEALVETSSGIALSQDFDAVLIPVGGDHYSVPRAFINQLQSARLLTKMESLAVAAGDREQSSTTVVHVGEEGRSATESGSKNVVPEDCLIEANSLRRFVEMMLRYAGGKNTRLPSVVSELRDNKAALQYERAYMLQGVLSTRLYLKRENRLSERRLARVLEPAFTLLHAEKLVEYPHSQLLYAWRLLLQNQPHDSICGCSVDEVHREMTSRSEKFNQVLNVLERRVGESLTSPDLAIDETVIAAFRAALKNPLLVDPQSSLKQISIFNLTGDDSCAPVAISWCEPCGARVEQATDANSKANANEKTNAKATPDVFEQDDLIVQVVDSRIETLIFTGTNQVPETTKVVIKRGFAAPKTLVPSFGYRRLPFLAKETKPPQPKLSREDSAHLTHSNGHPTIANDSFAVTVTEEGLVKVEVISKDVLDADKSSSVPTANNRVFVLNHQIKDIGDGGDSYNFDPLAGDTYLNARLLEVLPGKTGPLVASLVLKYALAIPDALVYEERIESSWSPAGTPAASRAVSKRSRSNVSIPHIFTTEIELRRSVPIVFFETTWQNLSADHRVEVFFDTGNTVEKVLSENHFSIIQRDVARQAVSLPVAAGTEAPLDRYPCQRFFIANGQAFFNLGLPEFGADGEAVSLTILRAVSALSRPDLRSRGGGAGPPIETPEANCLGENRVNYGWAPLTESAERSVEQDVAVTRAYQLAEQFENLSWTTFGPMPQESKWFFRGRNAAVRVVSSRVLESREFVEFRLLNTSMQQAQSALFDVSLDHSEALLTTADGRVIEILNALKEDLPKDESGGHSIRESTIDSSNFSADGEDFLPHSTYKIDLGINGMASIRLRLRPSMAVDAKTGAGSW